MCTPVCTNPQMFHYKSWKNDSHTLAPIPLLTMSSSIHVTPLLFYSRLMVNFISPHSSTADIKQEKDRQTYLFHKSFQRSGSKEKRIIWGIKIGQIHSQPLWMTSRRCGLLPNYSNFGHLSL